MFIETSGECAIHFDQEANCVTDTGQLFDQFEEEGAQMFKKVYSLYSAFYPSLRFTLSLQSAFYTQFRPLGKEDTQSLLSSPALLYEIYQLY